MLKVKTTGKKNIAYKWKNPNMPHYCNKPKKKRGNEEWQGSGGKNYTFDNVIFKQSEKRG